MNCDNYGSGFKSDEAGQKKHYRIQREQGEELLVAADCTAYAFAGFHEKFMKNRITLIGCPKLDAVDYSEKLAEILCRNDIKSITVVRMEVPCCGGIEYAVKKAVEKSGKSLPVQVAVVSTDGVLKGLSAL